MNEEKVYCSMYSRNAELYHHGIKGQKWGVRNGPPYPLGSEKLANKVYLEAKKQEPKISKDLLQISKNNGYKMYGLNNKLKTKESIQRKIDSDSIKDRLSSFKSAKKINDAVRYTFIFDNNNFVKDYYDIKINLENLGYKEQRCKNYFSLYKEGKAKHKQVTSVFETKDGYKFEIQFQTPESQNAKDKKTPLYEERRKNNISLDRQKYLESEMEKLAENVPYPKDISKIKSY